jgi:large subunit ribosomal protein L31
MCAPSHEINAPEIFALASRAEAKGAAVEQGTEVMKADIHPNYHTIKVVMTDGTEYLTRSTYGKEGDTLNLDIDPKTHPAWTGGTQHMLDRGGRVSRFNSRFGEMSFGKK